MNSSQKLRILVADDHYVVRIGLVGLINTEPDMEVIAEAENGKQAIEMFEEHKPDLLMIDSRMPGMDGVETTFEILKKYPEAKIIMLTAHDGDADIRRALSAGVKGYVLKGPKGLNILPALRAVADGKQYLSKKVSEQLASQRPHEDLTPREVDVLNQLAKGLPNKLIADELDITEHTVKDHMKNILAKLQVSDRTEAVTTAIKRGIIHL